MSGLFGSAQREPVDEAQHRRLPSDEKTQEHESLQTLSSQQCVCEAPGTGWKESPLSEVRSSHSVPQSPPPETETTVLTRTSRGHYSTGLTHIRNLLQVLFNQ